MVEEMGAISGAAVLKYRQADGGKNSKAVHSRRGKSNTGGLTCKKVAAPNSFKMAAGSKPKCASMTYSGALFLTSY